MSRGTMNRLMCLLVPPGNSFEQREQLVEIFENLRGQIPLLYAAALVNLIGMHVATGGTELALISPITFLSGLLVWRLVFWLFFRQPCSDPDVIRKELLKTSAFAAFFCIGFSIWAQLLISAYPDKTLIILLYAVLASLGAAYGLSSFPRAAILPLVLLGAPVCIRLMLGGSASTTSIALSVMLVLVLFSRLLHSHSRTLSGLVRNRLEVAKEHNRAISAELAARKRAEEDALTGLANRSRLLREIEDGMVRGPRSGGGSTLALIDLDGFKSANDAFGHAAGDAILETFAKRILDTFGEDGLVARMGGDEFAIFWSNGLEREDLLRKGDKICELAREPVFWDGKSLSVGASCGLTEAGPLSTSVGEYLRQADSALYEAKASGRGSFRLYDEDLFERDKRKSTLEALLVNRRFHSDITVEFQPIFSVANETPLYAEALARWRHDKLGAVTPGEFIEVAEQLGAIGPLNDALLIRAIEGTASWPDDLGLSFNLSALQISQSGAARRLLKILDKEKFAADRVMFEVTETAFLADLPTAKREMQTLREAGCSVALDDFGSGNASVAYLRDLVFDVVKLDGTLLAKIQHCARSRQIYLGLVELCHAAGARCVAEHVETPEQLVLIKSMGCDYAQGFHLGRPVPSAQLTAEISGRDQIPGLGEA